MAATRSRKKKNKKNNSRYFKIITILFFVILGIGLFMIFGPNTRVIPADKYFYIHTGDNYDTVLNNLKKQGFINTKFTFDFLAKRASYPNHVRAGKYKIKNMMSNYKLVKMLRNGNQVPVKMVINKIRTKDDFVRFVTDRLEADPSQLRRLMNNDTFLSHYGLDSNTMMCGIIPDTYEFWWNTSADKALKKLLDYQQKFWTDDRKAKAKSLRMSPDSVYIIASIVEEETNKATDKPLIASVYINRLRLGMNLQADPTLKYAANDFTLKRIYDKHKEIVSPYNTYMYKGLPPGPICTPSKTTIDATLNAPKTDYIFFCAKADFSGYSAFASNYADHKKNAEAFIAAQNERGIR